MSPEIFKNGLKSHWLWKTDWMRWLRLLGDIWVLTLCFALVSRCRAAGSSKVLESGGYLSCRGSVLQDTWAAERWDPESLWLAVGTGIKQLCPAEYSFLLFQLRLQWFALNALNFLKTLHHISRAIKIICSSSLWPMEEICGKGKYSSVQVNTTGRWVQNSLY